MGWKETVMNDFEYVDWLDCSVVPKLPRVKGHIATIGERWARDAQAEITWRIAFRAGQGSNPSISTVGNDAFKDGKKEGIREVVEWIRKQPTVRDNLNIYLIPEYELKEWGIE